MNITQYLPYILFGTQLFIYAILFIVISRKAKKDGAWTLGKIWGKGKELFKKYIGVPDPEEVNLLKIVEHYNNKKKSAEQAKEAKPKDKEEKKEEDNS